MIKSLLIFFSKISPNFKKVLLINSDYEVTYNDVYQKSLNYKTYFRQNRIHKGAKVAFIVEDAFVFISSVIALWSLGAIPVPVNLKQSKDGLQSIFEILKPDFIFYEDKFVDFVKLPIPSISSNTILNRTQHEVDTQSIDLPIDSTAFILLTSGSSGVPKCVPVSHKSLFLNVYHTSKRIGLSENDRILINTPIYTTSSIIHLFTSVIAKSSILIEQGTLFGKDLVTLISKYNCTGFGGVPVHFNRLLSEIDLFDHQNLSLRFLFNSGDHLPVSVIKGLKKNIKNLEIYCAYGLTEVAGRLCILKDSELINKLGSVGLPLEHMNIAAFDNNKILGPNQTGEIVVNGEGLMAGYLNNDKANIDSFNNYGFKTGDYGYIDQDGYLFLKGRKDDMIKVGGEKVSLKLVEGEILQFNEFKEFILTKVEDKNLGPVIGIKYSLNANVKFNKGVFLKKLKQILPTTHLPIHFKEVEELPKTASGKLIRK